MNKLKLLLPILLILTLLLAVPAIAEEAEDLTAGLNVKVVDKPGKVKCITDGKYTSFWESSSRKDPWVVISSDKPIYGLYLCFQKKPDSYEIQTKDGKPLAAGDTRYHHVFYELDGVHDLRIQALGDGKITMGFNEIFVFGEGEIPDWVQRWQEPAEKVDILFLSAHPDDELLFLGGAMATSLLVDRREIQVVYLTPSNTTRRSEALNGLWTMGFRKYPEFGPFSDRYAKTGKLQDSYDMVTGGKREVWNWMTSVFRKYKPEAVVTHDLKGEYGHPQHKMLADSAIHCYELAAQADQDPDSAAVYGIWQVKKLYLHLYGEEAEQTQFDFTVPREEFGGLTANELSQKAFEKHVTQAGMGKKFGGKLVPFSVEEYGVKRYPNNRFGLYASTVGPDAQHTDFLEHIEKKAEEE